MLFIKSKSESQTLLPSKITRSLIIFLILFSRSFGQESSGEEWFEDEELISVNENELIDNNSVVLNLNCTGECESTYTSIPGEIDGKEEEISNISTNGNLEDNSPLDVEMVEVVKAKTLEDYNDEITNGSKEGYCFYATYCLI